MSDRPRVHWVSPLPPAETDIAHYTARILPELARETDLTLWTDAPRWDRALERHAPVRQLDPDRIRPSDFAGAARSGAGPEAVFVHIGNAWAFHAGLLRLARRIPSIVVLHDLAIQEMCLDAVRNRLLSPTTYAAEMARWYGHAGAEIAPRVLDGRLAPGPLAAAAPGFELALDRATAVLTHTDLAFARVAGLRHLPVYRLELPFRPGAAPPAPSPRTGPLRLMQFGYIGPNRRLLEVLDVLGTLKDEIDFTLDVMGKVWDARTVAARAEALGIAGRVTLHGFVDEKTLDARLRAADLVFNLRWPTMGEASGSQLRIWSAGAPSVVSDAGWYAELDETAVFRVGVDTEADDLAALLRRLSADRSLGAALGAAGRARLEARHAPARYARGIAAIARRAPSDHRAATLTRAVLRARGAGPAAPLYARAFAAALAT